MDLLVEHLLAEVHRCRSSFPTRFSAGQLPPPQAWCHRTERKANFLELRNAEVQLRRIPLPRTSVNKALVRDAPGGSGCHYGSSKGGPTVLGGGERIAHLSAVRRHPLITFFV